VGVGAVWVGAALRWWAAMWSGWCGVARRVWRGEGAMGARGRCGAGVMGFWLGELPCGEGVMGARGRCGAGVMGRGCRGALL